MIVQKINYDNIRAEFHAFFPNFDPGFGPRLQFVAKDIPLPVLPYA